jgi:hypothetical protein
MQEVRAQLSITLSTLISRRPFRSLKDQRAKPAPNNRPALELLLQNESGSPDHNNKKVEEAI